MGKVQIWSLDRAARSDSRTDAARRGIHPRASRARTSICCARRIARCRRSAEPRASAPCIYESSGADSILQLDDAFRLRSGRPNGIGAGRHLYAVTVDQDDASSSRRQRRQPSHTERSGSRRGARALQLRSASTASTAISPTSCRFGEKEDAGSRERHDGRIFGNWQFNGSVQLASGTPFTAHVLSNVGDVSRGTNGTLRANYNGQPITLSDPTTHGSSSGTAAFSVTAAGSTCDNGPEHDHQVRRTEVLNLGSHEEHDVQPDESAVGAGATASNVLNTVQLIRSDLRQGREFADVRPGDGGPADAAHTDSDEIEVLK